MDSASLVPSVPRCPTSFPSHGTQRVSHTHPPLEEGVGWDTQPGGDCLDSGSTSRESAHLPSFARCHFNIHGVPHADPSQIR